MRPTNEILCSSGRKLLSFFIPNFSGAACRFDRGHDRFKNEGMMTCS